MLRLLLILGEDGSGQFVGKEIADLQLSDIKLLNLFMSIEAEDERDVYFSVTGANGRAELIETIFVFHKH